MSRGALNTLDIEAIRIAERRATGQADVPVAMRTVEGFETPVVPLEAIATIGSCVDAYRGLIELATSS